MTWALRTRRGPAARAAPARAAPGLSRRGPCGRGATGQPLKRRASLAAPLAADGAGWRRSGRPPSEGHPRRISILPAGGGSGRGQSDAGRSPPPAPTSRRCRKGRPSNRSGNGRHHAAPRAFRSYGRHSGHEVLVLADDRKRSFDKFRPHVANATRHDNPAPDVLALPFGRAKGLAERVVLRADNLASARVASYRSRSKTEPPQEGQGIMTPA